MSISIKQNKKVRIYLSNVTGLGATKLSQSLLPCIEKAIGLRAVRYAFLKVGSYLSIIDQFKYTNFNF